MNNSAQIIDVDHGDIVVSFTVAIESVPVSYKAGEHPFEFKIVFPIQ